MSAHFPSLAEQPHAVAASSGLSAAPGTVAMRHWARGGEFRRLLRTARRIPLSQLAARARFMAQRRLYALAPARPIRAAWHTAAGTRAAAPLPALPFDLVVPDGAAALRARAAALARGCFSYLGREADFSAGIRWRDPEASPLWAFNLHYLGAVRDLMLGGYGDEAQRVLSSWRASFENLWDSVAWHPYPASLRLTNLCLAAAHAGGFDALGASMVDLVARHAAFVLRHLEHDLRGNHLLENACALLFAGRFLQGRLAKRCELVAREVLAIEVPEQILPDGAHFELSPMYHAIVMHRLLQLVTLLGREDPLVCETLAPAVSRMAAFLHGTLCPDGDIPLLGDSVRGFGPDPRTLLHSTHRLGMVPPPTPPAKVTSFRNCGLHVFRTPRLWAIFDAGPVCPDYLPGHGQADSLTVEVWCDGVCIVGDPGVYDYSGPERAWGRSSRAHSTLTIDDANTSEVYGSFRVGGRARISSVVVEEGVVTAALEPFGGRARLTRSVRLLDMPRPGLEIVDSAEAPVGSTVRSRLHLHPAVGLVGDVAANSRTIVACSPRGRVRISARHALRLERGRASRQYGAIEPTTVLVQDLHPGRPVDDSRFLIEPLDG